METDHSFGVIIDGLQSIIIDMISKKLKRVRSLNILPQKTIKIIKEKGKIILFWKNFNDSYGLIKFKMAKEIIVTLKLETGNIIILSLICDVPIFIKQI